MYRITSYNVCYTKLLRQWNHLRLTLTLEYMVHFKKCTIATRCIETVCAIENS